MKVSLVQIEEHIKKYIEVITTIMDVDVGVADRNMIRVSGTGLYRNMVGEKVRGSVFLNTLKTGKSHIIENPREYSLCLECERKNNCKETLEISTPIYSDEEIIGVIGLVTFDEENKKKIMKDIHSYLNFTKQVAEFIGMKYKEYKEELLQREREETLKQILNNIEKGVIILNVKNEIISINDIGLKKLKLNSLNIGKKIKLINENESLMNEEIYKLILNNKEYSVTGKEISLVSLSQNEIKVFIFDDIQKISQDIVELTNQYNRIGLDDIQGVSEKVKSLKEYVKIVANSTSTVLITGESGTGKELIARSLHSSGDRHNKPFVVINCSAIPDSLLESELFGYVKGAFTGASNNGHMGKFELANKGVIFLDEIGDMPLYLQSKILRVIQEKKIERIGSNKSIDLDVKIIAATNANLEEKIKEKKFREDLYYRLNVIPIKTYSLREKKEDIPSIVNSIIEKYRYKLHYKIKKLDDECMRVLLEYDWPGNVRELENVIELIMNLCKDVEVVTLDMLPENIFSKNSKKEKIEVIEKKEESQILSEEFQELEKLYIIKGLEKYGNTTEGKKILSKKMDIGLTTLYRKIKKLKI